MPSFALFKHVCALSAFFFSSSLAADADTWRNRAIYQVMTDRFAAANDTTPGDCDQLQGVYCGGSWRGIMDHLDYIQGMNFDAIWISPIVAQMKEWTSDGMAFAGYWQQDLYSTNDAFGSQEDLVNLIDAVHERGMLFMLDVVVNHMAWDGPHEDIDYSAFTPFGNEEFYHDYCPSGYNDKDLENEHVCWLGSDEVPLADLKTEDDAVRTIFQSWIMNQVWKYNVDGLRIDAGINVEPEFFPGFMKAAGVFGTAEVYTSDDEISAPWDKAVGSVLNYPIYYALTSAMNPDNGDMGDLVDRIATEKKNYDDVNLLGCFSENHDVPRYANSTDDLALASNVAAYVVMSDGIPIVYNGQEQHFTGGTNPFTNREPLWETGSGMDTSAPLYTLIGTLNLFRRHITRNDDGYTKTDSDVIHHDKHTLALKKGSDGNSTVSVFSNEGKNSNTKLSLCDGHGYSSGTGLTEMLSCSTVKVDGSGCIPVTIKGGMPQILISTDSLPGSTLCGASGKSDVGMPTLTVVKTTWTTEIGGTPTVQHSLKTIPLSEATITPSSTYGGNGFDDPDATSTSAASAVDVRGCAFDILIPLALGAAAFSGGFAALLGRMPA